LYGSENLGGFWHFFYGFDPKNPFLNTPLLFKLGLPDIGDSPLKNEADG